MSDELLNRTGTPLPSEEGDSEKEYTVKFLASPVQEVVKSHRLRAPDDFQAGIAFQRHLYQSNYSDVDVLDVEVGEY